MNGEQTSLLGEIDARMEYTEKLARARIADKLEKEYMRTGDLFGWNPDSLPDGLVVIERSTRYLQHGEQKEVYYRCVVGHHHAVGGMMAHMISAPNEEWPEEPTWMYSKEHGCRWNYPTGQLWTRKEPEYDSGVKWADE